ncbi:MAG: EAL domain-containing protein [Peptococcaceae bacterium]|nr:EAL domain-containing protein [Peptococcaceae bacterium]
MYQPIVDLKTTEIVGADALIRWEHPSWGIVPTKELCAIAEEIGFIINLGKWMLEEVCRNYKEWLKKGLSPIKVALNYSGIQFFENNFAENVLNTIREYELDPSFLVIEITESTLIRNAEKVRKDIETLKTNGIQIALDDFGTGFSSLADLSAFPIDILKIDSLFIKNIAKDETCSVIAGSIINMARELQIKAVAEGIESWEQLSELKSLNCHAGQGYLYSKAVEPLEFTKLLAKKKCRPIRTQNVDTPKKQRRKFFRVEFIQSLEAEMTILEIKGKKIDVGNTKVLVKDIGPGGLCFISNIKLPIVKDFIMLFKTELLGKELKLTGYPVWGGEKDSNLYTYGVEFILDENDRSLLIHDLNKIQIKMRKKSLFTDGSFVTVSPAIYFKQFNN